MSFKRFGRRQYQKLDGLANIKKSQSVEETQTPLIESEKGHTTKQATTTLPVSTNQVSDKSRSAIQKVPLDIRLMGMYFA